MQNKLFKKGLIVVITVLFNGIIINPALGIPNIVDDTTPPFTICTLEPPEPNGNGHWYITDINVTLQATDNLSGVKEIYYRVNDNEWKVHYGNFIIFIMDQVCQKNGSIEFYSVDLAGNQEEIKIIEGIYIDLLPPYSKIYYELKEGNSKDGWLIVINAEDITDDCSGISNTVEFYLNGVLQETVTGPGPTYVWSFIYHGGLKISVGIYYCDKAGNCVFDEIDIKLIRNGIQQAINPLFLQLLKYFPIINLLIQRLNI